MKKLNETFLDDLNELEQIPNVTVSEISETPAPLDGPKEGEDTGIADMLLDAMKREIDNIQYYNMLAANINSYSHPEFGAVIKELANQANANLGKISSMLKEVSPNAENIMHGAVDAEEDIADDTVGASIFESFNKNKGSMWEVKYNNYLAEGKETKTVRFKSNLNWRDLNRKLREKFRDVEIVNIKSVVEDEKKSTTRTLNEAVDTNVNEWNFHKAIPINKSLTIEKRLLDSINAFCKKASCLEEDIDVMKPLEEDTEKFRKEFEAYIDENNFLEQDEDLKEMYYKIDELFEDFIKAKAEAITAPEKEANEYRKEFNAFYSKAKNNSVLNSIFDYDDSMLSKKK